MSASILDGVEEQYIDSAGKVRVLSYYHHDNISLITSPLPPLEADPMSLSDIKQADDEEVFAFTKERGLEVLFQDVKGEKTVGIWVRKLSENLISGYIPTREMDVLGDLDVTTAQRNPVQVEKFSYRKEMQHNSKIALYLSQYTFYEYSRRYSNSESFDENNFEIDPDHSYDLKKLKKKLLPPEENDVIYRDGKILVPDEKTRDKLLSSLRIALFNSRETIQNYSSRKRIEGYFSNLSDFTQKTNQLIFLSLEDLRNWKDNEMSEQKIGTVYYQLLRTIEPFFYRGIIGNGRLLLIQNILGKNLTKTRIVAEVWKSEGYNLGARPGNIPLEDPEYTTYYEDGTFVGTATAEISILRYNDGNYAALLPFE